MFVFAFASAFASAVFVFVFCDARLSRCLVYMCYSPLHLVEVLYIFGYVVLFGVVLFVWMGLAN